MWLCRAAAAALLVATPAAAKTATAPAFIGANRLYDDCKTENTTCVAYVMGVADTLSTLLAAGLIRGGCIPEHLTAEQVILAFQNYAREHPASLSTSASSVVAAGVHEAFPCH
jgi:Rap1a immunity proteins